MALSASCWWTIEREGGGCFGLTYPVRTTSNCDNPDFCGSDLGGFWGWVEFDRSGTTTWGDASLAGCGHTVGAGGPGSAGAGGIQLEITSWHVGPAQPNDPNPGGQVFYVDGNEATFTGHGNPVTV